jgi:hypothetical protein
MGWDDFLDIVLILTGPVLFVVGLVQVFVYRRRVAALRRELDKLLAQSAAGDAGAGMTEQVLRVPSKSNPL